MIRLFWLLGSVPTKPVSWGKSRSGHFKEDGVASSKQGSVKIQGLLHPRGGCPQGRPVANAIWSSGPMETGALDGQGTPWGMLVQPTPAGSALLQVSPQQRVSHFTQIPILQVWDPCVSNKPPRGADAPGPRNLT